MRRGWFAIAAMAAASAALGACRFTPLELPAGSDAPVDVPADDVRPDTYVPACLTLPSYTPMEGGHRYRVITDNNNFDRAVDLCAADGAHLAVIDSGPENNFLENLVGNNNEAWIGHDDLTQDTVFRTITTNAAATYVGFAGIEPNNVGNEDCVALRGTDGNWNDLSCEQGRRAVCECDPQYRPPPTPTCRAQNTPDNYEGRKIFLHATAATWADAEDECAKTGAHLVAIGDLDEDNYVNNRFNGDSWLGLNDRATEGTWQWSTGATLGYERWTGGQRPASNPDLDCVVIDDGGTWRQVACTETHPYACECDPSPP